MDNRKQHIFLWVGIVFCAIDHICLLTFFAIAGIGLFIIANLCSLAVYFFVSFMLVRYRCYLAIRAVIVCMGSLYSTFTAYMLGINNYVIGNFLLIIVLQLLLPYGKVWYRRGVMLASVILAIVSFSLSYIALPVLVLPDCQQNIFMAVNICIMLSGTCIEIKIEQLVTCAVHELHKNLLDRTTIAANTDVLTSAYNRRYAEEYIAGLQTYEEERDCCVAMVDADKFKEINDLMGHNIGNHTLIHITNFIRNNLRKDDMLFRWGGDEFLIILKGITLPQAHNTLDRIRKQLIETSFQDKEPSIQVSISVGVAEFDVSNPYLSIERCNQNLIQSKRQGRSMVFSGL